MKNPDNPEITTLCETRLNEITETDTNDLTEFAECRLVALGASPSHGEDVSQRALLLILQGLGTGQGGRRPRLEDLRDKPAFLNYVRGAISSIVHGMTTKSDFKAQQPPRDDDAPALDAADDSPAEHAELADLRDQIFTRLRKRAQPHLQQTIDAWEAVFTESDRIPTPGSRKSAHEVRLLAKDILSQIDGMS